jgi:beta-xylosidase
MGVGGGEVTVKLDVSAMADGQAAGLCHYGKKYAWLGVTESNGVRRITHSANGHATCGAAVSGAEVWLRSLITADGACTWAFSCDGQRFTPFGERYALEWAHYRGDRIGLFCYNNDADAGQADFTAFRYDINRAKGATQK